MRKEISTLMLALLASMANADDKTFNVGKPLVTINEEGRETPISKNVKVYGSFRFAESVVHDPVKNLLVVMNAGVAEEFQKNDGYVSLLNPDGTVHTTKWIGENRNQLNLNQPLGSCIVGRTLYAADIDTVRTFDLDSGKPGKTYLIEGATFLNGIAVDKDGNIYVSNTRPREVVYKISAQGEVSVFAEGEGIQLPNGVAIDQNGNVVIVNVGNKHVLTYDTSGKLLKKEESLNSGNDGVVILKDGTKYISSVRFGSITKLVEGKAPELIAEGIPSAASMTYDSTQHQLVIPMNNHNAMAFLPLDK